MPYTQEQQRKYDANRSAARKVRYAEDAEYKAHKDAVNAAAVQKIRLAVLSAYSGGIPACACCGTPFLPHLDLNHLGGGGAAHRRKANGGNAVYRELYFGGFPPGYNVLCRSCNFRAHHNYGECDCPSGRLNAHMDAVA